MDLFPFTSGAADIQTDVSSHIESIALLERVSNRKPDVKVHIDVDLEDYYRIKDAHKKNNSE